MLIADVDDNSDGLVPEHTQAQHQQQGTTSTTERKVVSFRYKKHEKKGTEDERNKRGNVTRCEDGEGFTSPIGIKGILDYMTLYLRLNCCMQLVAQIGLYIWV